MTCKILNEVNVADMPHEIIYSKVTLEISHATRCDSRVWGLRWELSESGMLYVMAATMSQSVTALMA